MISLNVRKDYASRCHLYFNLGRIILSRAAFTGMRGTSSLAKETSGSNGLFQEGGGTRDSSHGILFRISLAVECTHDWAAFKCIDDQAAFECIDDLVFFVFVFAVCCIRRAGLG